MTSYGAGQAAGADLTVIVELRSVNHRFLDVQVRVPRDYLALEPAITAAVKARWSRGRVEIFVRREDPLAGPAVLDHDVARRALDALGRLKADLGVPGEIDLAMVLSQPGVVSGGERLRDAETDRPVVEAALTRALDAAATMSQVEGDALARDMSQRFAAVNALRATIALGASTEVETHRHRLQERVGELLGRAGAGEIDAGRLLQEVAHLADRSDIAEELTRLKSHLDQCLELFAEREPVGRKLDFLLQELFRETNTITSKATSPAIKAAAVDIKVELERIREQVQNVE